MYKSLKYNKTKATNEYKQYNLVCNTDHVTLFWKIYLCAYLANLLYVLDECLQLF